MTTLESAPGEDLTHADILRRHLVIAGLSQRAAASELGIKELAMRNYCAGKQPVPAGVFLALRQLDQMRRNARVIAMLERGELDTSEQSLSRNEKLHLAIEFLVGRINQLEQDATESRPDKTAAPAQPSP